MLIAVARFLIKVLPSSAAFKITRRLASRTQRPPLQPFEAAAMAKATRLHFGTNRRRVAWSWGSGPVVIFVHGWGGRAAQMSALALHAASQGFRSVAIDISGHGDSPDDHARWEYFLRDIADFTRTLSEGVYAYVGHSAGGLTMMAARKLKGIHARRYVCICAPSHPYPPITAIRMRLDPPEAVVERFRQHLAQQFETTWEELSTGISFAGAAADTLLVYDEKDRYIDHSEGDKLKALCPQVRLVKTCAYGHGKILAAAEIAGLVADFLRAGRR